MNVRIPMILASSSPRRRELLSHVGLRFKIQSPEIDETPKPGEAPVAMVKRLAREKAAAIAKTQQSRTCVVAADTIVVSPNKKSILGKPRNHVEATKMLKHLSGKTHAVWTGFAISAGGRTVTKAVQTRVTFRKLSSDEIRRYVNTGEPMDKAGAYGAQGAGMTLIASIQGSYTNVVGLPVAEVLKTLRQIRAIRR